MTFLNPAILIGLAAATIPVIIHLLNLRKLKKIEFSTLIFLKELQKNKIRRVKLKQWLLLALRVLIILLIVTAFARPTLEGISIGGTTSAAKTTALFILDDSFSMSVVDQNGSYINQAKQTIKELLSNLEEGDEAGLILVSGDTEGEVPVTTNINSVAEKLKNINVSDASGTINSALIKASNLILESKNFNKEIYLLSDFQKDRIAIEQNLTDLSQALNEQVKLYSFDYSGKEVYNIGISKLKVITKIFEINKPISFEATVTNYSNQTVNNLVVSLFVGGKRSAQKSIDLASNKAKIVQLEGTANKNGFVDVTVEIEDDEVSVDNKRFSSIFIPDKISVLLLYDEFNDIRFVKLALQSAAANGNLELYEKPLNKISTIKLNNYDAVIIIGSKVIDRSDDLRKFLTDGGGVIIFPSSEPDLVGFRGILNSLKLPQAKELIYYSAQVNKTVDFEKIDYDHPLLQNIFSDEQKQEIESPIIQNYYKISPMGKGKSIITILDCSSFLSEYDFGRGKIFVFNVPPVLEWSDFPIKSIFAPLIYKSVVYLSAEDRSEAEYIAGEPLNINISRRTLPIIKVVRPDRSEDLINLNGNDSDFLNYGKTYLSGNYKIYSGVDLLETISVNTDQLESNVNYISDDEFEDYLKEINFKGSHIKITKGEDPVTLILQARFGSELWRYFLMAAFLLALIEMTIARSAKKELVDIKE
ncbi:MAG: BatA domain-containing protein [Bacteroidetes bacterium]|nr:BatA domain-containing protein [Bacteroidota bacterium]